MPLPLIILSYAMWAVLGAGVVTGGVLATIDRLQTKDVLRHNYPLLGRFHKQLDWLGRLYRNHFGAMDRQEMPFNRAQQQTVDNYAHNKNSITAFGSTHNTHYAGTPIFINAQFPDLTAAATSAVTIGPYCEHPYNARSIFNISGMSYGAISNPATRAFSHGAKLAGCWVNTGEGGLAPAHLEGGADIVFQIGTAKYGVRDENGDFSEEKLKEVSAHKQVRMIEIKLAQGAKPGKGGILPASKITAEIAEIRGIPVGKDSISPARHVEIGSPSELLDFVERVRNLTGKPVGIKTVVSDRRSVDALCEEIKKRGPKSAPDFITLDGGDGGSGAAPTVLMDHVGLPMREALPILSQALSENGLKDRVRIIASGKLITPERVAWALCAGADFVNSARGHMFAAGCVQSKRCDSNTCPTGITTNNPKLQKGMDVKALAQSVANYSLGLRHDVETIAHSCGVSDPRKLRPHHVRIVQPDGQTKPMDEIYPGLKF